LKAIKIIGFAAVGLLLLWLGGTSVLDKLVSVGWKSATATIDHVEVQDAYQANQYTGTSLVRFTTYNYHYLVNQSQYTGKKQTNIRIFPENNTIKIKYLPEKPEISVIDIGLDLFSIGYSVIFVFLGFVILAVILPKTVKLMKTKG